MKSKVPSTAVKGSSGGYICGASFMGFSRELPFDAGENFGADRGSRNEASQSLADRLLKLILIFGSVGLMTLIVVEGISAI
jgi:hypothetical protein